MFFLRLFVFRTMGYQQEVVERVVKETGQTEDTFLILEKIVQESKRSEKTPDGGQKDKRPNLAHVPSDSCSASQSGQKDQQLRKETGGQGRTKENIKPRQQHGAGPNGLGHRRQCSNSETQTQQVQNCLCYVFMFMCVCLTPTSHFVVLYNFASVKKIAK